MIEHEAVSAAQLLGGRGELAHDVLSAGQKLIDTDIVDNVDAVDTA